MASDMELAAPQFYCSKVQTTDGASWFVAVELKTKLDHPDELIDATFDLTITDGQRAWIGQDLNEYSLGESIPDRMSHALEALVQYRQPTELYSLKFSPHDTTDMLIEIEWDNARHGKDITSRLHCVLNSAPDNAEAVRELMKSILQASASLRLEAAALTATCTNLKNAIQPELKKLEEYAIKKENLDNDIALKGAALLVSKQEHLNELIQQQQEEQK